METNTFLWIGGIAIVVIAGICIIRKKGNHGKNSGVDGTDTGINNNKPQRDIPRGRGFNKNEPARVALIKNLKVFVPLLEGLDRGIMNSDDWKEAIVGTNNYELLSYWTQIKDKASSWITILQMWGIKYDSCTSFIGMESYKDMYNVADGSDIEISKKYKVLSPCWILTDITPEGRGAKKVIKKGIVEIS